jgi:hypothetical protein
MDIILTKGPFGLFPADDTEAEKLAKLKKGVFVKCKVSTMRNPHFHRKYFALLNFAFDQWEPENKDQQRWNLTPQKNFDQFRKDMAILAGFYDYVCRVKGESTIAAKSISFGSMSQEDFEKLYSKTVDIILERFLNNYTAQELDRVVNELLNNFT